MFNGADSKPCHWTRSRTSSIYKSLRLSRRWFFKWSSSGLWRRVVLW